MKTLYLTMSGPADAVRASIPLHLAVNGSLERGHDIDFVLAGDATELAKPAVRDAIEGIGVPPLRDLFAKAIQHEIPVWV